MTGIGVANSDTQPIVVATYGSSQVPQPISRISILQTSFPPREATAFALVPHKGRKSSLDLATVKNNGATESKAMHALGSGTGRGFTFYQFDAALRIRIQTTNLLSRFYRVFRPKATEIGALPNETICLTVFSLIVGRY